MPRFDLRDIIANTCPKEPLSHVPQEMSTIVQAIKKKNRK